MSEENTSPDLSLSKIDSNLVFTKFGELAKKRDELYSDYIEIDEPDEIGSAWVGFSSEVVEDLLEVIDLTKSLFDRLVDELRRSQDEPSQEELNRIRNLTNFWLDLSVLSYLYATLEKRGVLEQAGTEKYSLGYVNTKKTLDELTLLAFQAGQEFFTLDSRIALGETLALNMEKKRLDFLDDIEEVNDLKYQILGEYDKNQALFLINRVITRFIASAHSWWFLDPIALHSAAEHGLSHINSMVSHWSKCTSDLVERASSFHQQHFNTIRMSSQVALAQHYKRLAIAALESRANSTAAEYFGKAAELTSLKSLENVSTYETMDFWEPSIPEQSLIYNQMMHLSMISSKFQSIMNYLEQGKKDEALILIPEILTNISTMLGEGDVAYVSSVAVAYETVFEYLKEQLENNGDFDQIKVFIQNRLRSVGERLHKASHQITMNWIKVIKSNNKNITLLNEVITNIDYPLLAILILPPDNEFVEQTSSELITLKLVTEALNIEVEADSEFGKNPVKEMLMRAKTFELSQKSLEYMENLNDEQTTSAVSNLILPVAQNSFIRGLIAEIQLRTAVLQFRYINRIAPLIENSSLSNAEQKPQLKNDEEELRNFILALNELTSAATEVNKHQTPIMIGGAPLNWNYISKLQFYSEGLVNIVKSVTHAIQAAFLGVSGREDAVTNWDEAKSLAFKAADIIAKASSQESEELAQQVYTLAQVYYDYENKIRDRKVTTTFPVNGIVELISSLLMGL